jgi:hypothetical protein
MDGIEDRPWPQPCGGLRGVVAAAAGRRRLLQDRLVRWSAAAKARADFVEVVSRRLQEVGPRLQGTSGSWRAARDEARVRRRDEIGGPLHLSRQPRMSFRIGIGETSRSRSLLLSSRRRLPSSAARSSRRNCRPGELELGQAVVPAVDGVIGALERRCSQFFTNLNRRRAARTHRARRRPEGTTTDAVIVILDLHLLAGWKSCGGRKTRQERPRRIPRASCSTRACWPSHLSSLPAGR